MRLQEQYKKVISPKLKEKFGYKNEMQVPKIKKVVINVGIGKHAKEKAFIESAESVVTRITGQKPVFTKAKKSIASFKVREGQTVGIVTTLRGGKMNDFIERLIHISFPRIRDFRGINETQVDRTGNLTIGFKEFLAFPEIRADEVDNVHGLEVVIDTSAKTKEEGLELFRLLGFPFKKELI